MKKTLLSLALGLSFISQAADLDNKPDVTTFDIAGVRLGMSLEEAQAALKAKYPNGEMGDVYMKSSPFDMNVKVPNTFKFEDGQQKLTIYFNTNTLNGKRDESVVSRVFYSLPSTDDNLSALQAAAKEKYGEPTLGGSDSNYWRWCKEPEKSFSYECPVHKIPSLSLSKMMGVNLDLQNPEYRNAEQEALEATKNTKPNI